jgi:DNA-binding FadR family transcriptional regulator
VSVTDEAIERIKGMIISKELRPGDRLPREVDLAEQDRSMLDLLEARRLLEADAAALAAQRRALEHLAELRARIWRGITEGGAIDRTIAEHRAICDAIERGSSELARAWMTAHLASVEAWLRQAVEPAQFSA